MGNAEKVVWWLKTGEFKSRIKIKTGVSCTLLFVGGEVDVVENIIFLIKKRDSWSGYLKIIYYDRFCTPVALLDWRVVGDCIFVGFFIGDCQSGGIIGEYDDFSVVIHIRAEFSHIFWIETKVCDNDVFALRYDGQGTIV